MRDHPTVEPAVTRARRTTLRSRAALAMLICGCAYPMERGQRLEQRLERLENQRSAGQAKAPGTDDEQARHAAAAVDAKVDTGMAEVRHRLDVLETTAQRGGGARAAQQAKLSEEMSSLRTTVDGLSHRLDSVERSIARSGASSRASAAPRVATRAARAAAAAPTPESEKHEASPAPALQAHERGTQSVIALAREQELKGQKRVAHDLYQEFVDQFPSDPAAAQAHFRLGELAYGERRYRDAITEYGKVASDFPRSEQAPDALLRTADSMMAIGLKADALTLLAEIPKRYPASPAAARARQRLAEINGARSR
jgi:tol-pal system protein YbgF